jgi:hypothetical protein
MSFRLSSNESIVDGLRRVAGEPADFHVWRKLIKALW